MKSYLPKDPGESRSWQVIDATEQPVGRLAVKIANILRGKDKPTYSPQVDTGGFVVVINAEKVVFTGQKETQKSYTSYSRWPGGLKRTTPAMVRARHPDRIILTAVKGMLPRNTICRNMMTRLKVYAGEKHPHAAQIQVKA